MVTAKKKHVSKKNKKDWRKHCDIRDVEEFLEDQRLEERLGKFDTKPDSDLFIVDTGSKDKKDEIETKPLTSKQRKRALLPQVPKCFEVLQPSSKVLDPNSKRNHVNQLGSKPTALSKLSEQRNRKKGVYERKQEDARKNRKIALDKKRKIKQTKQNFELDLWGEQMPEAKGIPASLCEEFVSDEARLHNVSCERRLRRPPPAPPSLARPAVTLPHPGVSYNPSLQEHQSLLSDVVQHELGEMKREAHLLRVTNHMFTKCSPQEKQNQWLVEMSGGLETAPSRPEAESGSDGEYRAVNPPVRNKKKDHKARRKQRERLAEKERLKRAKIEKKKISDIYRLRKIQSSLSERAARTAASRGARRGAREARRAAAPPALSAHRPAHPQPDLLEPHHLTGDLRRLHNISNPLRERFESLQRRGALAASKLMMKKKRKLKPYFKPGHKVTDAEVDRYIAKTTPTPTN